MPTVTLSPPVADGGPFQVIANGQNNINPTTTTLLNGNLLVTWWADSGTTHDVYGRLFDPSGNPIGEAFGVAQALTGSQMHAHVTVLSGGGFVVSWTTDAYDVRSPAEIVRSTIVFRLFDADGTPAGDETPVPESEAIGYYYDRASDDFIEAPLTDQTWSDVGALPEGGFVVTWHDYGADTILAQRYAADGTTVGSVITVGGISYTEGRTQVTPLLDGGFVVTWQDRIDGAALEILARVYSADGQPEGPEIRVNGTPAAAQYQPMISALVDGGFVVVWHSSGQEDGFGVYGQVFNADGSPRGSGEILLATAVEGDQLAPTVTGLTNGGFVVTWIASGTDGSGWSIAAQVFNPDGSRVGTEIVVNTFATGAQRDPSVTATPDGGFTVTWSSQGQDGAGTSLYSQTYNVSASVVFDPLVVSTVGGDGIIGVVDRDAGLLISGTADADATLVEVRIGANRLTATVNADGTWSVTVPTGQFPADGLRSVSVRARNSDGRFTDPVVQDFTVDTRPPATPVMAKVTGDDLINAVDLANGVVLTGRAPGGADTVKVTLAPGFVVTGAVADDGTWSITVPNDMIPPDGRLNVRVQSTDEAGNTSEVLTQVVRVDRTNTVNVVSTTTGPDNFGGSIWDDRAVGKGGNDTFAGGEGQDTLKGAKGNDLLVGDQGDDLLDGGAGNDTAGGGDGDDVLLGKVGSDRLEGDGGNDSLSGAAGTDQLFGGDGDDSLNGGSEADALFGGAGNDLLQGGSGKDTLEGEDGNDTLNGGEGFDEMTGGLGADLFQFARGHVSGTVTDFNAGEGDRLELNDNLWSGNLSAAQVVARFARVTGAGDTVFTFADGDRLILTGITDLTEVTSQIDII